MLSNMAWARLRALEQSARYTQSRSKASNWIFVICYLAFALVVRVETPAWQSLAARYAPWYRHITSRAFKAGDPFRALLQTIFLLCIRVEQRTVATTASMPNKLLHLWQTLRQHYLTALQRAPQWVRRTPFAKLSANRLPHSSFLRNPWVLRIAALGTVACSLLLVTQPFNILAQTLFVVFLWCLAMAVRHVPGRLPAILLVTLSLLVSGRYIWWRYTSTLNWNNTLDLFLGLLLLMAETYSWLVLILGYVQSIWPLNRKPKPLPKDLNDWPTVDLMIPTYDEDLKVVMPTVYAALNLDWPQDKLRIHLLDDGKRESFRLFAESVGVNYIIRPDGRHAKAGNLNHAMGKTDADLIAIFDCDHIPARSFLQMTVGWFFADPKLALVQTPHYFFSPDPFERNLENFGKTPNENALFYGVLQDGNDLWNASFFCGSCAVLKRSALESIDGFAVETVTEDAHTALRLHRNGYTSAYLRTPQAAGLATDSLSAHIGQRIRWARGMVQIFRTDNPLFGKGLSIFQRLCYVNGMLHFLAGIPRIIYLLAPLAFLLLHSYIIYAPAIFILLNIIPHIVHANLTNSRLHGQHRHSFWSEVYETVLSWYIARPTTVALFAPHKGKFNVTAKGGLIEQDYFDWKIALPYAFLAVLNIAGLGFGIWRINTGPETETITTILAMLWVCYNLVILGGALGVAAEVRQIRYSHRVQTRLPAYIKTADGRLFSAELRDFSDRGLGLHMLHPIDGVTLGAEIDITLFRGTQPYSFTGSVVRLQQHSLGIFLAPMSLEQQGNFIQCTLARADSWLALQKKIRADRPLRGAYDVLSQGLSGYHRIAKHAPFPFSIVFDSIATASQWLLSFAPRYQARP